MKVLLCGEGAHDVGRSGRATTRGTEGWMQPLVRRMLQSPNARIDGLTRPQIVMLPRDRRKHQPLPDGHGGRALAAKLRALSDGYDLVIFMVDADSTDRRDFARIRQEILAGLHRGRRLYEAACVPMATSESWLLCDRTAWIAMGLTDTGLLPRHPETTWGMPRNPTGHHPHMDFQRVCENADVDDSPETRAELASRVDLAELRRKCPVSFGTFADDLATALAR